MAIPNPMLFIERLSISAGLIAHGISVSNVARAGGEADLIQSVESQSDQPQVPDNVAGEDSLAGFFAIGVVVNIALVAAYIIWAYRQWKRKK